MTDKSTENNHNNWRNRGPQKPQKRDDDSNKNIGERLRPGVHTKTIGIKVLYFSDECNNARTSKSAINYWNHQPTSSPHTLYTHSLTHSLYFL
jgi:hypothetical protein